MIQYDTLNIKLWHSYFNKLNSEIKNYTELTLNLWLKNSGEFPSRTLAPLLKTGSKNVLKSLA